MSFYPVAFVLRMVETAARVETHAATPMDSATVDAPDYARLNDFLDGRFGLSMRPAPWWNWWDEMRVARP